MISNLVLKSKNKLLPYSTGGRRDDRQSVLTECLETTALWARYGSTALKRSIIDSSLLRVESLCA